MNETRRVEQLLHQQGKKRAELAEIERQMRESKSAAAIVFVDLQDSTEMKEKQADQEWLSFTYRFIEAVGEHIRAAGGVLVKRIGDGLMASFDQVAQAETLLDLLEASPALSTYSFRTAADFGEVYFFKFEPHLAQDPYGRCVDRCARLLHLSLPGANLCGEAFVKASSHRSRYSEAGNFSINGFSEPQRIFFRLHPPSAESERFLEPLLLTLNKNNATIPSYRHAPRVLKPADFSAYDGAVRPFLLRELLNVPKLPMSHRDFTDRIESALNKDELREYCGMLIEWELPFGGYNQLDNGDIQAYFHPEDHRGLTVMAALPPFMLQAVRALHKSQKTHLRGIISGITGLWITLNYVDLELCSPAQDNVPSPAPH